MDDPGDSLGLVGAHVLDGLGHGVFSFGSPRRQGWQRWLLIRVVSCRPSGHFDGQHRRPQRWQGMFGLRGIFISLIC